MKRWIVYTDDGFRWRNIGADTEQNAINTVNAKNKAIGLSIKVIKAEVDPDQSDWDEPRHKSVPV